MLLHTKKSFFKKTLASLFIVVFLVTAVTCLVSYIRRTVGAVTQSGELIHVSKGVSIDYGHGWATSEFSISVDGQSVLGYCANPSKESLEGYFPAMIMPDNDTNDAIKLLIYVSTVDNSITRAVMDDLFSDIPSSSLRYAYTHAAIGVLYANDYHRLDQQDRILVDSVVAKIEDLIDTQSDAWAMAKNYVLFTIDRSDTIYADSNTYQDVMWIEEDTNYGSIRIQKRDIETQSATSLGNANLQGITFSVYNNSGERIYNPSNGRFYNQGDLVASGTTNANGEALFSDLLLGAYQVKETGTNNSYNLTATTAQNTTLSISDQTQTLIFYDQVIRGNVRFRKVDSNSGDAMANIPFRIKSNTTGESHIIVTDANGVMDTSSSVNPHSRQTNGYDNIANPDNISYQGYGTWFGQTASGNVPANNTLGALPYDTYTITEIACDQNKFCRDIASQVKVFSITANAATVDLGTWNNDCASLSITTTATDNADGDKLITADTTVKIKDTIDFCAKTGTTFTIKGSLMDKTTGQPIMQNGVLVEESIVVTPTSDCEQTEMIFSINTSSLAGHEIVVFEKVYHNNDLVVAHENINDPAQTVNVVGLSTTPTDNADGDKLIPADSSAKIKDVINYCLKPGTTFTIKGTLMDKTANKVLTNNSGQVIEQTVTVTPTANCGQAEMIFSIDASSFAGHEIVVFEKVYQGSTLIVTHENINDVAQTVNIVSLTTTATDNAAGDKLVVADSGAKIKDTIDYCLKTGVEFTIKGTLMDKTTGKALVKGNGQPIESVITVNPTATCGQAEMYFEFDASLLAGHKIVVFEKAYQGNTLVVAHENIDDVAQTVNVIGFSTFAENGKKIAVDSKGSEEEEEDNSELLKKYVEVENKTIIKDTITYCLKANTEFTFKGTLVDKETGEALTIDGKIIEESIDVVTKEACGQAEMIFEFDASSLAGHDIVVFEKLYYNDKLVMSHEDLEDEEQTVFLVSLTTFATSADDNNTKDVLASGIVRIVDEVRYCLKADTEYTVKGILMNKETKKPLLIDGKTVEQTITFIPENTCGKTEMIYEFDATSLGGTDVVIFEEVYLGKSSQSLFIKHEDFENEDETFYILTPTPDTGYATGVFNNSNEKTNITVIVGLVTSFVAVAVCFGIKIIAKRNFLKRL